MKILIFVVGYIETNMYLIVNDRKGIVIDPGFIESEQDKIIKVLRKECDAVPDIILTHCHFDHITGCSLLKQEFKSKIYCHRLDREKLRDPEKSGALFLGVKGARIAADELLDGGEELSLLNLKFRIIHTPGHTQGSISILVEDRYLFSGDTIFKDSIGRYDLDDGCYEDEISSITSRILVLPDDTVIYPGHGAATTVKEEKKNF